MKFLSKSIRQIFYGVAFTLGSLTASAEEPIITPIIDCHVHLFTFERPEGLGWIKEDNKILYRDFLVKDHKPIAEANGVTGVVVVQAGQSLPDNQWNLDVTAEHKDLYRGVVGNLSLVIGTDEFKPLFEQLCKDKRYVGYRISGRPEGKLSDTFFRDLKLTAKEGRTLDILLGGFSLADAAEIAQRVPELKIIIDHMGGVQLNGEPLDPEWIKSFRAVAKHKNVTCKISALYGRVKKQPAPQDINFYKEVLDLSWECYGEDRIVYGSDWPVTRTSGDYASVLKLTRAYFDSKGKEVSAKLFYKNAARFYGVSELAP
jgi:predicted TIM-barrel fold metal-dependent hydrolase